MGYRSDVIALIYPDAESSEGMEAKYGQLKTLMATTFKDTIDGTPYGDGFHSCMEWLDSDCVLKFRIPDVKWYPSYPDVQAFAAMLGQFSSEEIEGYCTEYVRVGEDSGDVDAERSGANNQYYLSVRQEIDCNV
jgi:hypothetical protein